MVTNRIQVDGLESEVHHGLNLDVEEASLKLEGKVGMG